MNLHTIWLGPIQLCQLDHAGIKTAADVYKIKPILWVDNPTPGIWLDKIKEIATIKSVYSLPQFVDDLETRIPHPRHRCDLLRLQIIHEYGGMYCDTDIIWIKPILSPEQMSDDLVLVKHGGGKEVGNAFIYTSEPGNALIEEMFERAKGKIIPAFNPESNSPLGMDVAHDVITKAKHGYTKLEKGTLFRYYYDTFLGELLFPGNGEVEDIVCGIHWWRTFFKTRMEFAFADPAFISESPTLLAKYLRMTNLQSGGII